VNEMESYIFLVTSIPRLCASLISNLISLIPSRPQFLMPADEYLIIGEKKLTVE